MATPNLPYPFDPRNTSTAVLSVALLADLRALLPGAAAAVILGGTTALDDAGAGVFVWDGASVLPDDGLNTIASNSQPAVGRWRRIVGSTGTLAGDAVGSPTANTVAAIHGVTTPALPPQPGQFVKAPNNASLSYAFISVSDLPNAAGDVTGPLNALVVGRINGTSVPATPSSGQFLKATGATTSIWTTISSADLPNLSGDAVGSPTANTVVGLTGTSGVVAMHAAGGITADGAAWTLGVNGTTTPANVITIGNVFAGLGASFAGTGILRLPNNASVNARNAANTGDVAIASVDVSNNWQFAASGTGSWVLGSSAVASGFLITGSGSLTFNVSSGIQHVLSGSTFAISSAAPSFSLSQGQSTTGAGVTMSFLAQGSKTGSGLAGGGITYQTGSGDGAGAPGSHLFKSGSALMGTMTFGGSYWSLIADVASNGLNLVSSGASQNVTINASGASGFVRTVAPQVLFQDGTGVTAVTWNIASAGTTSLQFAKTVTSAQIVQLAQTTDTPPTGLKIAAQDAYASATLGNRQGASLILQDGKSAAGVTYNGGVSFQNNGVEYIKMVTTIGASPATKFLVASNSTGLYFDTASAGANGLVSFSTASNVYFYGFAVIINDTSTEAFRITPNSAGTTSLTFAKTITSAQITQAAPTSDVPTSGMIIQAQSAWGSAVTNLTGGTLFSRSGVNRDGTTYSEIAISPSQTQTTISGVVAGSEQIVSNTWFFVANASRNGLGFTANGTSQYVQFQSIGTSGAIYFDTSTVNFRDSSQTIAIALTLNATGVSTFTAPNGSATNLVWNMSAVTANNSFAWQGGGATVYEIGSLGSGTFGVHRFVNLTTAPTSNPSGAVFEWAKAGEKWGLTPNGVIKKIIPDGDTGFIDETGFYKVSTTGSTTTTKDYDTAARSVPASSIIYVKIWVGSYDTTNGGQEEWVFEAACTNIGGTLLLLGSDQIGTTHSHGTVLATTPTVAVSGTNIRVTVGGSQVGAIIHHIVRFQVSAAAP